jgi:hypothetical protein
MQYQAQKDLLYLKGVFVDFRSHMSELISPARSAPQYIFTA